MQEVINKVEKPINKNAKLEIQSEINKLDIISKNELQNIIRNQIIV